MSDSASPSPRLRLRWWMWPILALVIILAAMMAMRLHGYNRWLAAKADLAARGWPTDPASLLATAPPVDRDRQERLYLAMKDLDPTEEVRHCSQAFQLQPRRTDATPESIAAHLASASAGMASIEAILDQGPVEISIFGSLDGDPGRIEELKATGYLRWTTSVLKTRTCATWWGAHAIASADPIPDLQRLDRLHASLGHPGTLLDAMFGMAAERIRDDTYLWLASRGRLPETALAAWTVEESAHIRWLADAFAGERCLSWEPMSRSSIIGQAEPLRHPRWKAVADLFVPVKFHDLAWGYVELARTEAELRKITPPSPCQPPPFGWHIVSRLALPNNIESLVTATESAFHQRSARIAGLLAARYRAGQELPADLQALANLLPPHGLDARSSDEPAIRYERLSPCRFRVGIDPSAKPPAIPASRWSAFYGTSIGQPAATNAIVDLRWSLEIDLDAILVAPPQKAAKPAVKP